MADSRARVWTLAALALVCIGAGAWAAARAAPTSPARPALLVPDLFLVQWSPPDERYDQAGDAARIAMLSRRVRRAVVDSGRYRVLDRGRDDRVPPYRYLDCKPCTVDWARRRGADEVLVGWVQKESELILNVNLVLIDLRRHDAARGVSVELRGDTDATWQAGARQLLDRLLGVVMPP